MGRISVSPGSVRCGIWHHGVYHRARHGAHTAHAHGPHKSSTLFGAFMDPHAPAGQAEDIDIGIPVEQRPIGVEQQTPGNARGRPETRQDLAPLRSDLATTNRRRPRGRGRAWSSMARRSASQAIRFATRLCHREAPRIRPNERVRPGSPDRTKGTHQPAQTGQSSPP